MYVSDFLTQHPNKRRTVEDLIRYVRERSDQNPNYCLLLGAGCSVSSGIRSGRELVSEWRRKAYQQLVPSDAKPYDEAVAIAYLSQYASHWYNANHEYSCLFEKHYDLPRQRRMFIEQEVANKSPSWGYLYLIRAVERGLFRTVFTTNFDDLINEAFYQFSQERPIVCAHDSTVQSILVTSRRPKIIKLHGDYLFDDIKSTLRETESLEENTRSKLLEFCKDFGLVVMGYGGTDRSVMDALSYMLRREEHLTSGLYWCARGSDRLSEELQKLLWRDRVYCVETEGFDQTMAEIYQSVAGDTPPMPLTVDLGTSQDKLDRMTGLFLERAPKHPIIERHASGLRRARDRNQLYELLNKLTDEGRRVRYSSGDGQETASDEQFIAELRIQTALDSGRGDDAEEQAKQLLATAKDAIARRRLYRTYIDVLQDREKYAEARAACLKMREDEPQNPEPLLIQTRFERAVSVKLELLSKAAELNPHYVEVFNAQARVLLNKLEFGTVNREKDVTEILRVTDQSIAIDPDPRNPAWGLASEVIELISPDTSVVCAHLQQLIDRLRKHDTWSPRMFQLRVKAATRGKPDVQALQAIVRDAESAKQRGVREDSLSYDLITLDALGYIRDHAQIRQRIREFDERHSRRVTYLLSKARLQLRVLGDLQQAIGTLRAAYDIEESARVLRPLINALLCAGDVPESKRLLAALPLHKMTTVRRLQIEREIAEHEGDYATALDLLERELAASLNEYSLARFHRSYLLLCAGKLKQAEDAARATLEEVNFSTEYPSEIINYELARYLRLGKTHKERLAAVVATAFEREPKFSAYLLLGDKEKALEQLRAIIEEDFSSKFVIRRWPLLTLAKDDNRFHRLLSDNEPPTTLHAITTEARPQGR